jgi:hypothetical protein
MNRILLSLAVFGLGLSAATAQTPGGGITSSNSSTCTTLTLKSGESPPLATPTGTLPAGEAAGQIPTSSSQADGSAVVGESPPLATPTGTLPAGEAAGQIPTSSSQADGSTVVVDANGKCTIYRSEPRQPNPSR